jgi:hypothetical protein
MAAVTRTPTSKTRAVRGAAKPLARSAKRTSARTGKAKAKGPKRVGPVDDRAVRRAVGAAMFNPATFMGLHEQSAEPRAKHWAEALKERTAEPR